MIMRLLMLFTLLPALECVAHPPVPRLSALECQWIAAGVKNLKEGGNHIGFGVISTQAFLNRVAPTLSDDIRSVDKFQKLVSKMDRKPNDYTIAEVSGSDLMRFVVRAEDDLSGSSAPSLSAYLIVLGNLIMFVGTVGIQDPAELRLGIKAVGLLFIVSGVYRVLKPSPTVEEDEESANAMVKSAIDGADREWLLTQMKGSPEGEQVPALASSGRILAIRKEKDPGSPDLESTVFYFILRKGWI